MRSVVLNQGLHYRDIVLMKIKFCGSLVFKMSDLFSEKHLPIRVERTHQHKNIRLSQSVRKPYKKALARNRVVNPGGAQFIVGLENGTPPNCTSRSDRIY